METQISSVKPPEQQRINFLVQMGCVVRSIMSFFVLIGVAFFLLFGVWPAVRWWQSQGWVPTKCKIQSARIVTNNNGGDGVSYLPKIHYAYRWKEADYQGNLLELGSMSYSRKSSLEKRLKPFAAGIETQCFVNPAKPEEAVLLRDFPQSSLIFSAVGLVFTSIGIAALRFRKNAQDAFATKLDGAMPAVESVGTSSRLDSSMATFSDVNPAITDPPRNRVVFSSVVPLESQGENQPQVINPEQSRLSVLLGLSLFGLIWNGIVGVALFFTLQEKGGVSIGVTLFLIPFIIIGAIILFLILRQILCLANPQPAVVYSDNWIYPGSEFEVSWMMKGKASRIRRLSIFIEGIETVTFRQGTTTRSESNTFYRQKLVECDQPERIAQGYEIAKIPSDTMHTFNATNNKISWQVRFEGEIPWWPDVSEKFPLIILPPSPPQELL